MAHSSLLRAHSSKLTAQSSKLKAHCSALNAHSSKLTAHSTTLKAHCLAPIAHSSILIAHRSQLNAQSSLLIAHSSQLTAQRSQPASTKQLKPAVSISKDVKCLVHVTVAEVDARAEALVRDVVMQDVVQICSGIVESAAEYIGRDSVAGGGGRVEMGRTSSRERDDGR